MNKYLTYNKVINLICCFWFFRDLCDYNILFFQDIYDHDISYLTEKYYLIFNSLPNKNIDVNDRGNSFQEYKKYIERWKLKEKKNDYLMFHAIFYICNGILTPNKLNERYSYLFTSYKYINEECQIYKLHRNIIDVAFESIRNNEHEWLIYKRFNKIVRIKKMINEKKEN